MYPIGDRNLTQDFKAIGQETKPLNPFIFKCGGKMSYPIVKHVKS